MKRMMIKSIIDAFVQLCNIKDFEHITVKELCELSEISKPTFYKYFKDKYDAAAHIYLYDAGLLNNQSVYFSLEAIQSTLSKIQSHRIIYLKAFESKAQNSLYNFLADHTIAILAAHVEQQMHRSLTEEEQYTLCCYAYGWVHGVEDWLSGKTQYSIQQLALYQQRNVPLFLQCEIEHL